MAGKRITKAKLGDVFEVKLEDDYKAYFQFIALDIAQLNSEVIRVFKKRYCQDENPLLEEIVKDEVAFYAHVIIKFGIKLNVWEKVGNVEREESNDLPFFRDCKDYGNPQFHNKKSKNWHVWQVGKEFDFIGELTDKERIYDNGMVINPLGILELLKGNKYPVNYPR